MKKTNENKLCEILINKNLVTQKQIDESLAIQKKKDHSLFDILLNLNYVSSKHLLNALSLIHDLSFISLDEFPIDPTVVLRLPCKFAKQNEILTLSESSDKILVATCKVIDNKLHEFIENYLDKQIVFSFAEKDDILTYSSFANLNLRNISFG